MINDILSKSFEGYFDFLNKKMIEDQLSRRGIKDEKVLNAFAKIKRHKFLPEALLSRAYDDYAIEVYPNQTISQPYIIAFMLQALDLKKSDKVLEIGTGTGFQTALLCELSKEVFSLDIKENMKTFSKENLKTFGFENFNLFIRDGKKGLPENAPYDKIIVSCAAQEIPAELTEQMSKNSKMIIPVGKSGFQNLKILTKTNTEKTVSDSIAVSFVPMI